MSIAGLYDFNKLLDGVPSDATFTSANVDFRARIEAGFNLRLPKRDIFIQAEGLYDGIGAPDFEAYGGTLKLVIPF